MYVLMTGLFLPCIVIRIYLQLQHSGSDVSLMLHA